MRIPDPVRALVPAAALVAVAATQIVLARSGGLSPWKGGGFGMFSTLDHGAFRRSVVVVEGPDRSETLTLPASLDIIEARARQYPATRLLSALGDAIVRREARHGRPVTRVRISILGTAFDRVTLRAHERPIRAFVHDAGPAR